MLIHRHGPRTTLCCVRQARPCPPTKTATAFKRVLNSAAHLSEPHKAGCIRVVRHDGGQVAVDQRPRRDVLIEVLAGLPHTAYDTNGDIAEGMRDRRGTCAGKHAPQLSFGSVLVLGQRVCACVVAEDLYDKHTAKGVLMPSSLASWPAPQPPQFSQGDVSSRAV